MLIVISVSLIIRGEDNIKHSDSLITPELFSFGIVHLIPNRTLLFLVSLTNRSQKNGVLTSFR